MTSSSAHHPADPAREALRRARRVIVKVGSAALVSNGNHLDEAQLRALVNQMADVRSSGREIVCVTSGAVAAGLQELGLKRRPRDLPSIQAAAAVGQARLIELYRAEFAKRGLAVGQVLLIHDDLRARVRHLNASNTLSYLLQRGAVPIINENDTVAVDEIRFGDNDRLAALVACLIHADLLILLTTADGLLDRAPSTRGESAPGSVIPTVERITPEIHALAGTSATELGVGGMKSKLQAAEIVGRAGIRAVIANAREPDVLPRILSGEPIGTLFLAPGQPMRGRQRWIAFFEKPQGALYVDAGAARAMRERHSSLLAIGITRVDGRFGVGAPLSIIDERGAEIARGLVNYASDAVERIRGRKSAEIAELLGACEYEEVVHRDNMVLA